MARTRSTEELAGDLVMNAVLLTRTLRALTRSGRLTEPEISALAVIVHAGRIVARDLAQFEEVTPATISRLVAAMEAKGLVRRTTDRKDTRLQWIVATPLGAKLIREGHAQRLAPLVAALDQLPRAERQSLEDAAAVLARVVETLRR